MHRLFRISLVMVVIVVALGVATMPAWALAVNGLTITGVSEPSCIVGMNAVPSSGMHASAAPSSPSAPAITVRGRARHASSARRYGPVSYTHLTLPTNYPV